jgi:hypothetical protein
MFNRLVAAVAAVSCVCVVFAQSDNVRPTQGMREIGVGGQWVNSVGNDMVNLQVDLGYHFGPQIVGEFAAMYMKDYEDDMYGLGLGVRYLLTKENPTVPYLQAGVMYYNAYEEDDFLFVGGVGVEHFITPSQAFYLDVKTFKPDGAPDWIFTTSIGLRFAF